MLNPALLTGMFHGLKGKRSGHPGARAGCQLSRRAKGRRSVADMAGTQQIFRFPPSLGAHPAHLTLSAPTMPAGWMSLSLTCRPLPSWPLPRQTHAGLLWSHVAKDGPFSPSLPLRGHSGHFWCSGKLALFSLWPPLTIEKKQKSKKKLYLASELLVPILHSFSESHLCPQEA